MSKPGVFACEDPHPLEQEGFSKAESAPGYEVVTDTRGGMAAVFDGLPWTGRHPPEADKRPAVRHRRGVAAVSHGKINLSLRGRAQPMT